MSKSTKLERSNFSSFNETTQGPGQRHPLGKASLWEEIVVDSGRTLKFLKHWFAQKFYKRMGKEERSVKHLYKKLHVRGKMSHVWEREKFGNRILIRSNNIAQMQLFKEKDNQVKVEEEYKQRMAELDGRLKSSDEKIKLRLNKNFSNLLKNVQEGVCMGAVAELASNILEEQNFDEDTIYSKASQFENGIAVAGVVNQLVYVNISKFDQSEMDKRFIMKRCKDHNMELNNNELNELKNKLSNPEKKSEIDKKINQSKELIKKLKIKLIESEGLKVKSHSFNDDYMKKIENMQKSIDSKIKECTEIINKFEIMNRIIQERNDVIQRLKVSREKPQNISRFNKLYRRIFSGIHGSSNNLEKKKVNHLVELQWRASRKEAMINQVIRQRGLELESINNVGMDDEQVLGEHLPKLEKGVYDFSFSYGKENHAALLIKSEENFYLWDPTVGLLRFEKKDFCKTILEFLNVKYPITGKGKGNHLIELGKYHQISS